MSGNLLLEFPSIKSPMLPVTHARTGKVVVCSLYDSLITAPCNINIHDVCGLYDSLITAPCDINIHDVCGLYDRLITAPCDIDIHDVCSLYDGLITAHCDINIHDVCGVRPIWQANYSSLCSSNARRKNAWTILGNKCYINWLIILELYQ